MHRQPLSVNAEGKRDFDKPTDQDLEILSARKDYERQVIMHDLQVMVDELGVSKTLDMMHSDTYWKFYTFFKNTQGDADR